METQGAIIPIDKEKERFYNHLSFSDRTIFSAKFGDGKTFFLENFFEQYSKEFYCIKIYPVNYQIEDNKDIFELIKKDILIQLLANNAVIDNGPVIDNTLFAQYYLFHNGGDIILDILSSIPQIKAPVEIVQKTLKHLAEFKKNKELTQETTPEKISKYIQNITDTKISCEYDSYSEIITKSIIRIKQEENKKVVLVIEDLDRMDPAHIFRILNIVSAHIDRVNVHNEENCNQPNNKFDFDKIIIVCDHDNIEKIFHHFYGPETDFKGYINKFSTGKPFYYSLKKNVKEYVNDRLSELFKLPNYKNAPIKLLEEELSNKTIRECVYILSDMEAEIKPDYITLEKFKISTISPGTLLLVLLNRLGINISQTSSFINIMKEDCETFTNIIGVNWLLIYEERENKLWIPQNNSPHCSQYLGLLTHLHIENNIVQSLKFDNEFLESARVLNGLEQIKNKLTSYIKS